MENQQFCGKLMVPHKSIILKTVVFTHEVVVAGGELPEVVQPVYGDLEPPLLGELLNPPHVVNVPDEEEEDDRPGLRDGVDPVEELGGDAEGAARTLHGKEQLVLAVVGEDLVIVV